MEQQEIYLDANATTPVLPQARAAALAAMAEDFGNPSSAHGAGLRARALLERVRATARRVLGAPPAGQLLFTSGATEGIQTAVLSALQALRARRQHQGAPTLLLYGATEHKAVPQALRHWNTVLGLDFEIRAIPVGRDGRHDLAWLREQAPRAGLVCTMAANNETGVISDLDGIAAALGRGPAQGGPLWLVDGVQALGKLALRLGERQIDYAPFSGHKLYAPKGIGLLYVRAGAPFTPLLAGGGQEGALRAGTENMAGIAALGAVLEALEDGTSFQDAATLARHRERLAAALAEAFPGLVFNAPAALSLPTTLNFAVPGLSARLLLDLFDAAGLRVSGGSACGAAQARPSDVLEAMGLPAWQSAAAVRLSFGAADGSALIDAACERIRACGAALRAESARPPQALTRWVADGVCCYLLADAASRRCVVIDPLPELGERLAGWLRRHDLTLAAVLSTQAAEGPGWPQGAAEIVLGTQHLTRLDLPGASVYLLHDGAGPPRLAFVGDAGLSGALAQALAPHTLLLPRQDPEDCFAHTLDGSGSTAAPQPVELDATQVAALLQGDGAAPRPLLVDVREPHEQLLSAAGGALGQEALAVPLSALPHALPDWLALPAEVPLLFYCRSGKRSAQAARALRRLGRARAWSLDGGLARWPATAAA